MRRPSMNVMVVLTSGGAKSLNEAVHEGRDAHDPAWLAKMKQFPNRRPQRRTW